MTTIRRFLLRLLSFFRITAAERELSREIHSHLQLLEDDYAAKGLTREEARLAARRAFGGVEQAKEHQRDTRGFRWLDDSRIDFKLGARMLAKYPGLSIIGGAGLAVGVALGAGFFAFFYSYIYATLPVEGGDRIVALENWDTEKNNEMRQAMHDLHDWRRDMKTVTEIGAFRTIGRNLIIPGGSAEPVQIAQVTATGFNITRVQPVLGRPLLESDERPGAPPVVVIGHDAWQSRFSGASSVIGQDIRFGNIVHTIVGVMPAGFGFPINHSYWTPLDTDTSGFARGDGPGIFIFGRLRDGVTLEQADAELSAIGAAAAAAFPQTHAKLQPRVLPYAHPILDIQGITTLQFTIMQTITSLLLVIVAVNVGVLVYARTATRQSEIAVRSAIGATRRRIVAQLFIEALVLCGVASAAGIALAKIGLAQGHAILALEGLGSLPYFINVGIPLPAYVYIAGLTLFAAVIAGVLPALHATGRRLTATLKQIGGSDGLRLGRTWTALIIAQVAIAVAGLPATVNVSWYGIRGSMTTANYNEDAFLGAMVTQDPDPPPGMSLSDHRREAAQRFAKLTTDLIAALEAEPVVADVTVAQAAPGAEPPARIEIDGATAGQSGNPNARYNHVGVDFFDAFDARLIAGRTLRESDGQGSARNVVVNRTFVERILGGTNAIGRRIRYVSSDADQPAGDSGAEFEIVGVVTDLQTNTVDTSFVSPIIFHAPQAGTRATTLIKLRSVDPAAFAPRLRTITAGLDPTARLHIFPFAEMRRQETLALRLILFAVSLIVITALLLSAAGIYALMSFTVSQRRKEIGIRAAMGADARQLLRGIFAKSALQLGAGVAVGIALGLLLDAASSGELLGAFGRGLLPVAALVMVIVGLIATIGPARRGLRIQPTEALRAE